MGLYPFFKKKARETTTKTEDKDTTTFPNSKGEVSLSAIKNKMSNISDLKVQDIEVNDTQYHLLYLSTMVRNDTIQQTVLQPIHLKKENESVYDIFRTATKFENNDLPSVIQDILNGMSILLSEDNKVILGINTISMENRSIKAPENESTVLGPQDSFTESLNTNLSLLKRRIRSEHLKSEEMIVGTEMRTRLAMLYMDNIANDENVNTLRERIQNVEYQGFTGLSMLKQSIEDNPLSPFPQFALTSRPDNVTAALLGGRIIVILDNSPESLICPSTFLEFFNSPEDFYNQWTSSTLIRFLRLMGFFVTLLLSSTYVSVLTFHPEMLPPHLLTLLAESRAKVPFPPVIEVLIMELVIEILREAGARMPTKVGQTIGIVGGIVIGTAAVEAGLASNILIVVVAVTALLSFIPSNYLLSNATRFIRYFFIIAGGILGMLGQMICMALLMNHLLNLTSLGTPYLTPIIPRKWGDLLDSVIRSPLKFLMQRSGAGRVKKSLMRPLDEE